MRTNPYQPPGTEKSRERWPSLKPTKRLATLVIILIQWILLYVHVAVDFGFDHRVNGLDFGDRLFFLGLFALVSIVGVGLSWYQKQWVLLAILFVPPILLPMAFFC